MTNSPHSLRTFARTGALVPLVAVLLAAGASVPSSAAQEYGAPFTIAESGRGFSSLQEAVKTIGDGAGTIVIAPGTYTQCSVQEEGSIVYRAAEPGSVIFNGGICEGKSTLVLRGNNATVDGIIFQDTFVDDGNGSGIRLEEGNLTVNNAMFRNAQQGILTAHDPSSQLVVRRSTFSGLGRCDGGNSCSHSIYGGHIASVTVERSRFEAGTGGHYVKSRARVTNVLDSSFDDTRGRATNFMIDMPNGSRGRISGNKFVQGRDKENYGAFIAVGAEDVKYSSMGLDIANNEANIAPGIDRRSTFIANWTNDRLNIGTNRLGPHLQPYEKR